ncbi:hypothetical protein GCM10008018_46310 [Paenibacillus marchantiophytorum]|uniref:Response regulator n=1 Tax=Paenibacillus marchantiophytorum TaxID=1619310 RepID=A0ABQ1EZT5_9BACL|nr:hypothetical protein [Paenibacillus marchantiophytorum]GFZ94677.1 hypothetical protein GCM10008018_46310 [Paenibacillus marchantiophytorum]
MAKVMVVNDTAFIRTMIKDIILGMGQQAMVLDAIPAGARDFIVKPILKYRVVEAVNKALHGTGERD